MIVLDATTKKLEIDMDEAMTTTQPTFYVSYADRTTTTYVPGENHGSANGTTEADLLAAPGASTQRVVKIIIVNNLDTVTHNIIIQIDVSGTNYQIFKAQLLTTEELVYTDGEGWRVFDANGNVKNTFATGGISAVSAGTTQVSSGQLVFSNANNFSFGVSGNTVTARYLAPLGSLYQNMQFALTSAIVFPGQSTSIAVQFNVGNNLSIDFLRIPAIMSSTSTTLTATISGDNGSVSLVSTFNAVIYSQDTGTNSSQLVSVLKGSCGWTLLYSISVEANASRYSVSSSGTFYGRGITSTAQETSSAANSNTIQFAPVGTITGMVNSVRFLDIPLNTGTATLTPGAYWLMFGISTNSGSNNSLFSIMTAVNYKTSALYGASQANLSFGVMGSTNRTSCLWGAGSFTTAGGGITSPIPISAISSGASNPILIFQLLGSNAAPIFARY